MRCPQCGNTVDGEPKYGQGKATFHIMCGCGFNGLLEYFTEEADGLVRCYRCGKAYPRTQMKVVLTKHLEDPFVICGACFREMGWSDDGV